MARSYEPDEATKLQARASALPLARRGVVLLAALSAATASRHASVLRAIDDLAGWGAYPGPHASKAFDAAIGALEVSFFALSLIMAGVVAVTVLRMAHVQRRVPSTAAHVRGDGRGLFADGKLVVARADVASVEVTTDAHLGFAVVATARDGVIYRVPLRFEDAAQALAATLARRDRTALVFEGVADRRARETRLAVLATATLVLAGIVLEHRVPDVFYLWAGSVYGHGWYDRPQTLPFIVTLFGPYGPFLLGPLAAALIPTLVSRARPGRVTVRAKGMQVGEGKGARTFAREDIVRVEEVGAAGLRVELRDGTRIGLRFDGDRPVAERGLLLAQLRASIPRTAMPSRPEVAASGVRITASAPPPPMPEEESAADQASRARRAG